MKVLSSVKIAGYLLASLLGASMIFAVTHPTPVHAEGSCEPSMLGIPAWYRGLTDANCDIVLPSDGDGVNVSDFVSRLGVNLVEILLRITGYVAAGYIIYGGYKYIISAGSSDGMASAKKTVLNACIGLVLSIAAVAIVRTLSSAFGI